MNEIEFTGKRINLDNKNIKRIKIMSTLLENETNGLNEKKKMDYIINKAIESYYSSSEIKELLDL